MMNRRFCGTLALALLLSGCAVYPRYRTGGARQLPVVEKSRSGLTTNECLRLGMILQSHLGRPYRGRSPFLAGVDCSLFIREVFQSFNGTELPRTAHRQYQTGREIPYRRLAFGDLVFFRTQGNKVSHVGVHVGANRFIHASTSRGVIISGLHEKYWAERYAGARRIL